MSLCSSSISTGCEDGDEGMQGTILRMNLEKKDGFMVRLEPGSFSLLCVAEEGCSSEAEDWWALRREVAFVPVSVVDSEPFSCFSVSLSLLVSAGGSLDSLGGKEGACSASTAVLSGDNGLGLSLPGAPFIASVCCLI